MASPSEALQSISAVIITGGSSGIGKSFIELGRKLKPDLTFCNLSRRRPAENISPNAGKSLNHFPCDLAIPDQLAGAAENVTALLRRTTPSGEVLLINNSGIGAFGSFPVMGLSDELQMIDVNVRAVVHLTGLLLPFLRERGGVIMNIASTVAFQPTPQCATYGATKAFVLNWTVALNDELRGTNVRAMAVCPGTTRTDFFRRAGVGTGGAEAFAMSSEEVALEAFRALAARKPFVVTGRKNKVLAFLGARAPKTLAARITAMMLTRMRLASPRKDRT